MVRIRLPPAERVNKLSVSTDEDELCAIHLRNRLEGRLGDPDAIRRLILAGGEVGRETPVAAKTCLVDPHSIADGGTDARLGDVQSGNRQQAAGLRCRFNSSGGRRTEWVYGRSRHSAAEEDRSARQV